MTFYCDFESILIKISQLNWFTLNEEIELQTG